MATFKVINLPENFSRSKYVRFVSLETRDGSPLALLTVESRHSPPETERTRLDVQKWMFIDPISDERMKRSCKRSIPRLLAFLRDTSASS